MYKLIAIDLDGTLLDDKKQISDENLDIINRATESGYEVVIATGRRYWSAKELTEKIDQHITIVANNGNIVRNSINDETLISKYLNKKDYINVVTDGKKRNLDPIIHLDNYTDGYDIAIEYERDHDKYYDYMMHSSRFKKISDFTQIDDRILAVVYPGRAKQLNDFYLELINKYPGVYNAHVMENMVLSEALLEVMNPKGTKWLSLVEYAASIDIKPEEIIAIGDNNNDVSMIRGAGLGIAMKNASESLKKLADIISTRDNNQSGVAFELERVLGI